MIESRFYRVEFDPATGGDREHPRQGARTGSWSIAKAPFRLNQYVYVAGGNGLADRDEPDGPTPNLKLTGSGKARLPRARPAGRAGADRMARREPPAADGRRSIIDRRSTSGTTSSGSTSTTVVDQEADLRQGGRVFRLPLRGPAADLPLRGPGGDRQRQQGHAARGLPRLVHRAALRRGRRPRRGDRLGDARRPLGLLPGHQPRQVADASCP